MVTTPETFSSGGSSLSLDVFMPASASKVPFVLVLHGSDGLLPKFGPDIVSFAEALVESGIGAAIPHYLDATGTKAGDDVAKELKSGRMDKLLSWRQACLDALAAMAGDARVDAARMGVLGFSLGGYFALSVAMDPAAAAPVRAVTDFFGPTSLLAPPWSRLPPVLIFHGDDDDVVHITESKRLVSELKKAGRKKETDLFYEFYPGQGHGFTGTALADSRDRTIKFFETILQDSP